MQIFVDADACPMVAIVEKIAKENSVSVTLLCDTNHVLSSACTVHDFGSCRRRLNVSSPVNDASFLSHKTPPILLLKHCNMARVLQEILLNPSLVFPFSLFLFPLFYR